MLNSVCLRALTKHVGLGERGVVGHVEGQRAVIPGNHVPWHACGSSGTQYELFPQVHNAVANLDMSPPAIKATPEKKKEPSISTVLVLLYTVGATQAGSCR